MSKQQQKSQAKKWYKELQNSGDLLDMFPTMSGNWEEDCDSFMVEYEDFNINIYHVEHDELDDLEITL